MSGAAPSATGAILPAVTRCSPDLVAQGQIPYNGHSSPTRRHAPPFMPRQPPNAETPAAPLTGLVLTGGGARAAYQVGVLQAISELRRICEPGARDNPFPIMAGTSAGAINAAALACGADQFDRAVRRVARVWSHFHVHHVYRSDSISMLRSGARYATKSATNTCSLPPPSPSSFRPRGSTSTAPPNISVTARCVSPRPSPPPFTLGPNASW